MEAASLRPFQGYFLQHESCFDQKPANEGKKKKEKTREVKNVLLQRFRSQRATRPRDVPRGLHVDRFWGLTPRFECLGKINTRKMWNEVFRGEKRKLDGVLHQHRFTPRFRTARQKKFTTFSWNANFMNGLETGRTMDKEETKCKNVLFWLFGVRYGYGPRFVLAGFVSRLAAPASCASYIPSSKAPLNTFSKITSHSSGWKPGVWFTRRTPRLSVSISIGSSVFCTLSRGNLDLSYVPPSFIFLRNVSRHLTSVCRRPGWNETMLKRFSSFYL